MSFKKIEEKLQSSNVQDKTKITQNKFIKDLCLDQPNILWKRKIYIFYLLYEPNIKECDIPNKVRFIQMNNNI